MDAPSDVDPAALIEMEVGTTGLWPLSTSRLAENTDDFFDVIEVLHDLVSRPRTRACTPTPGAAGTMTTTQLPLAKTCTGGA